MNDSYDYSYLLMPPKMSWEKYAEIAKELRKIAMKHNIVIIMAKSPYN